MKKLLLISLLFAITIPYFINCSETEEELHERFQTITREHEDEIFELLKNRAFLPKEFVNNLELGLPDDNKSLTENFKDSFTLPMDLWSNNDVYRKIKLMINCLAKEKYWRKQRQSLHPNNYLPPLLANQLIKYYKRFDYESMFLTPLAIYSEHCNVYLMNKLLEAGADPDERSMNPEDYKLAEFLADFFVKNKWISKSNNQDINESDYPEIRYLWETSITKQGFAEGIDIRNTRMKFSQQDAPIHIVCSSSTDGTGHYYGTMSSLKLLLQARANVNIQGKNGDTPLHRLARSPYYEFIESKTFALQTTRMLLAAKADPLIKNNNNQTALDISKDWNSNKKYELIQLLENAENATKNKLKKDRK